jgi:hypothetical protein
LILVEPLFASPNSIAGEVDSIGGKFDLAAVTRGGTISGKYGPNENSVMACDEFITARNVSVRKSNIVVYNTPL